MNLNGPGRLIDNRMTTDFDLASLIRNQVKLEAVCEAPKCRHVSQLNVSSLASRFGNKITLAEIASTVRCEECRSKAVLLRTA